MSRSQLVFLSAGEVSGDLHAARLVEALRARVPGLRAVGIGSHRMKEAGVELLADITPYSAVGLLEHLPGARPISRAFAEARDHLRRERPDAVVVVDYQGANVPLARYARELGLLITASADKKPFYVRKAGSRCMWGHHITWRDSGAGPDVYVVQLIAEVPAQSFLKFVEDDLPDDQAKVIRRYCLGLLLTGYP